MLLVFCLGFLIPENIGTQDEPDFASSQIWRVILGVPLLITVIQCTLYFVFFEFETPKFLQEKGRKKEVRLSNGFIH